MAMVDFEVLRNLPFLEGASSDVLERLAEGVVERSFQPDQVILEEGSTGREMYLIVEGQVEVAKGRGAEGTVLARDRQIPALYSKNGDIAWNPSHIHCCHLLSARSVSFGRKPKEDQKYIKYSSLMNQLRLALAPYPALLLRKLVNELRVFLRGRLLILN